MNATQDVSTGGASPTKFDGPSISDLAEFAVATLRDNDVSDADILARYVQPEPAADAAFEARQIASDGYVYAPAASLKAAMRAVVEADLVAVPR